MTYRHQDMPVTESGIVPDIILNPNALPKRMTLGQLIECVFSKVGAVKGMEMDGTPFNKIEVEQIVPLLESIGFTGAGTELMYNGKTGEQIESDIFIGPTFYYRLKHLVEDKVHSRSSGPYQLLTMQPAEGRSRDGGLRFGEMERDCKVHGTPVTLSNNLSIEIQDMTDSSYEVLGFDLEKNGLVKSKQIGFMDKGERDCIELTLEDGRKIGCTPDHPLLTENGTYVKAKDIELNKERVKVGITCPVMKIKEEIVECNNWKLELGDLILKTDTKDEYLRTLAFVRIVGYMLFDGHITTGGKGSIFLGHHLDVDTFMNDLKLFCVIPSVHKEKHCYRIYIPSALMKNILKLDGLTIGRKVNQEAVLPKFILDNCPRPILREVLAGMFGADGHTCYLGLHRGKRDLLTSISFSKSKQSKYLDSLKTMLEQIKELFARFDINNVTIQNPKQISNSKDKTNRNSDDRVYEMVLHLSVDELIQFSEKIGFRYCCHKSQRLEAGISYKRLRNEVTRQHNWLVNRVDEITNFSEIKRSNPKKIVGTAKAIVQAVKELESKEALMHKYSIPTTHDITDHLIKGTEFGKFRAKGFPTADEFMTQIDAREWFSDDIDTNYGVGVFTDSLPTMHMRVLSRFDNGPQKVYDISVEKTHSVVANGVVAHNCMISHGTVQFIFN